MIITTVVGIIDGRGLGINMPHEIYPKKSKLAL